MGVGRAFSSRWNGSVSRRGRIADLLCRLRLRRRVGIRVRQRGWGRGRAGDETVRYRDGESDERFGVWSRADDKSYGDIIQLDGQEGGPAG